MSEHTLEANLPVATATSWPHTGLPGNGVLSQTLVQLFSRECSHTASELSLSAVAYLPCNKERARGREGRKEGGREGRKERGREGGKE